MAEEVLRLYHGTSTLFLDGIAEHGLGGLNPIAEWRVLDFAQAVYQLAQEHLATEDEWKVKAQSFGYMVEQKSAAMNFQHGHTYLSASGETAIRYSIGSRLGSELVTYCHDFLDELLGRGVPGVRDRLYRQFPQVFLLRDISCAPVLIEANGVELGQLLDEDGSDASENYERALEALVRDDDVGSVLLQQVNFRLTEPVDPCKLRLWLVSVSRPDPYFPDYTLYPIDLAQAEFDQNRA